MPQTQAPAIAGREAEILHLVQHARPVALDRSNLQLASIDSSFACALHLHQPVIPAGADGELISHLRYMVEHPDEGDNHNAEPFAQCYRRMANLLPELIAEGCNPRIMLDVSGTLLWGIAQMGRDDIVEAWRYLACDQHMQGHVEWLGTFWGHAVASSTPIPDLKLQILAWQHQFAALFGDEALTRVKGFSPPEMHLPNHPDTLYALVEALLTCGFRWLLVQEHSVENPDGSPLSREQTRLPNRLVARNANGETLSITALIKTQGSDTKLVGQMQPCYEALGLGRQPLGNGSVPALVAQIADGENGGVMMNEFPEAFRQANRRLRDQPSRTCAVNGSEWIELLEASGVDSDDYPVIQATGQQRLWQQLGEARGPAALDAAIATLQSSDPGFAMEGASWTNNLSWVEGYANVLEPMNQLSAQFHARYDASVAQEPETTATAHYQQALLHLLLLETSCFRYWGQGTWTEYARELYRQGLSLLQS